LPENKPPKEVKKEKIELLPSQDFKVEIFVSKKPNNNNLEIIPS
jgi:hypothetical protein